MTVSTVFKFILLAGLALLSADVLAANAGMPWEGPIDQFTRSIQGPVLKGAAIVSIVLTGLGIAYEVGGPIMQKAVKVGSGISVSAAAAQWGLPLLGFGNAMVF
jgi:type IV secretory pathway VirB2 component (pilin)